MNQAPAIIRATWKPADLLKCTESRGKPKIQARGSWLDDLAATCKAITLCFKCTHRFNAKGYGYAPVPHAGFRYCYASCDGCRNHERCTLFKRVKPR